VVSATDPYGSILGFLDRTCCVNPIDNTHYAPITATPSIRTKYVGESNINETHGPARAILIREGYPLLEVLGKKGRSGGSSRAAPLSPVSSHHHDV
jgi:hypothetical protein